MSNEAQAHRFNEYHIYTWKTQLGKNHTEANSHEMITAPTKMTPIRWFSTRLNAWKRDIVGRLIAWVATSWIQKGSLLIEWKLKPKQSIVSGLYNFNQELTAPCGLAVLVVCTFIGQNDHRYDHKHTVELHTCTLTWNEYISNSRHKVVN